MKKPLTLAAWAALALGAQAQSTTTVSGIADLAVRSVNNSDVGSIKSLVSGSNSTSRLVFRGTEDLGGGLSAGFHLESGLALDTGANTTTNQFFDRRSTLSLFGTAWGEMRAGRDFVPSYVGWSRFDPFGYVGAGGSNNFVSATPNGPIKNAFASNPNTTVRSSNALQWLLPSGWGGMEGGVMLALGEGGTVANGQHKVKGFRIGWAGGPAVVSFASTTTENNLTAAGKFKDNALGGSYTLGDVKLSAAWREFSQASAKQTNTLLALTYVVGQTELKASLNRANLDGTVGTANIGANDAQQLALGAVYNLSKRTGLYATYSRVSNDGAATFVVPGGPAFTAAGTSSTGYEVGLRHSF